jgi:hypothetical protein
MAPTLPAHDRTIDTLRQKIRDAETRAAWHGAFRRPDAEREVRSLLLTLRHDLETLLASREAAARTIWAHRDLGSR